VKANVIELYIKRQIGGRGSVTLEFAHNAAIVGLSEYYSARQIGLSD
jgi:hypothetical protein